jgi:hypothetical protein
MTHMARTRCAVCHIGAMLGCSRVPALGILATSEHAVSIAAIHGHPEDTTCACPGGVPGGGPTDSKGGGLRGAVNGMFR